MCVYVCVFCVLEVGGGGRSPGFVTVLGMTERGAKGIVSSRQAGRQVDRLSALVQMADRFNDAAARLFLVCFCCCVCWTTRRCAHPRGPVQYSSGRERDRDSVLKLLPCCLRTNDAEVDGDVYGRMFVSRVVGIVTTCCSALVLVTASGG